MNQYSVVVSADTEDTARAIRVEAGGIDEAKAAARPSIKHYEHIIAVIQENWTKVAGPGSLAGGDSHYY